MPRETPGRGSCPPVTLLDDKEEKDQSVSGDLDQRAEILEEPERRQGEPADPAERAASKHRAVIAQRLAQAAVPAPALFAQRLEGLRHLGPRHRMRKKGDAAVESLVADVAVQSHHDLHVLAHRPGAGARRIPRRSGGARTASGIRLPE